MSTRWVGHVECMGKLRNAHILIGKFKKRKGPGTSETWVYAPIWHGVWLCVLDSSATPWVGMPGRLSALKLPSGRSLSHPFGLSRRHLLHPIGHARTSAAGSNPCRGCGYFLPCWRPLPRPRGLPRVWTGSDHCNHSSDRTDLLRCVGPRVLAAGTVTIVTYSVS
jgi:hypothetical protein